MDWHDNSCTRPDITTFGGDISCLSCGSFGQVTETAAVALPPIRQRSEIRTMRILPGEFNSPLRCEVFTQVLSTHAEYDAISYTWADECGDAEKSKIILLSDQPFAVTTNCENVLRRVRNRFSPHVVWIDAVCIDQENIDERGQQVQLMPKIYSTARKVLIYVGESTYRTKMFLGSLSEGFFEHQHARELLSRRYFSRVWTLQEAALARNATLVCGEITLPWQTLRPENLRSLKRALDDDQLFRTMPPVVHFDHTTYSSPGKLLKLLDLARNCEAEDPRDKVFALLGLIPGGHIGDLEADYNLTVEEVYTRVALHLASSYGWKAVLSRAGIANRSLASLPSWVPDWSHQIVHAASLCERDFDEMLDVTEYEEDGNKKREIRLKLIEHPSTLERWHVWDPNVAKLSCKYLCFEDNGLLNDKVQTAYRSYREFCDHRRLWDGSNMPMGSFTTEHLHLNLVLDRQENSTFQILGAEGTKSKKHWSCISLEAAVQIFTLTSAEIHELELLRALNGEVRYGYSRRFQTKPLSVHEPFIQDDISRRLVNDVQWDIHQRLETTEPIDAELEGLWRRKFDLGELDAIYVKKALGYRLTSPSGHRFVTGDEDPVGTENFIITNDMLWRLLVRSLLIRETTGKIV